MSTTPTKVGYRYSCPHSISLLCNQGDGKPTRKKCSYCGGTLRVVEGYFGVFTYNPKGVYRDDAAHSLHSSRKAADKAATGELVVRWVWV